MEIMTRQELEERFVMLEKNILNEIRKMMRKESYQEDEYLNIKETTELLGCSPNTAYQFFNHPTFPAKKITGKYSKREVLEWMKKKEVKQ